MEHLTLGRALAQAHADPQADARACRWMARVYELRGDYAAAFEWVDQGLLALTGRDATVTADLRAIAGLIHARQGQLDKAEEQARAAATLAQAQTDLKAWARAEGLLGFVALRRGLLPAAAGHFQHALELYLRTGDIQGQAVAHNQLANVYFGSGDWPTADHHYRQARATFDQIGDRYNRAIADNNLGGLALPQGRFDEALQFYQTAVQTSEQIGAPTYLLGMMEMNLGAAFIRLRQPATAREHLQRSQSYFEQAQARDSLPELLRHLARAALMEGEASRAEQLAHQALSLARELSLRSEEGCALRVLGEIYNDQNRAAEAEAPLTHSVAILEEVADEYELARSRFSLARAYSLLHQPNAARIQLDQCLPVFERLEARPDLTAARTLKDKLGMSQ